MKNGIVIALLLLLLGAGAWILLRRGGDPGATDRKIDSLSSVINARTARIHDLDAERSRVWSKFDSLKQASDASTDSLVLLAASARKSPRVVEIIRTVPEISTAFAADDSVISTLNRRLDYLHRWIPVHRADDDAYKLSRDSLDLAFIAKISTQEKKIKRLDRDFVFGINIGPGVVVTREGKIYAGATASVGLTFRLRRRHKN